MSNHPFHIAELITLYFQDKLTSAQMEELDVWLSQDETNRKFLEEFLDQEALQVKLSMLNEISSKRIWDKAINGIRIQQESKAKENLWPRFVAAACVIFALGIGFWFMNHRVNLFQNKHNTSTLRQSKNTFDIVPGTVGATLTLATGQKILLSNATNGQLALEAGVIISKTADGQLMYEIKPSVESENSDAINTLTTGKGQTYIVTLPDNSKVWMNAASSLTYSSKLLDRGMRKVTLEGEAYFEISKDKSHPFIVETGGQRVQVLGTHFNINSYEDEASIKTTLLEGSIRVERKNSVRTSDGHNNRNGATLKPNQQSICSEMNGISVVVADTENVVAWKNGMTSFKNADIKTILRQIARWYNVEIENQQRSTSKLFSGDIPRNANLSEVIKVLEFSGVKLKVEGRTITVLP